MDENSLSVLDEILEGACRAVFEGVGAPLETAQDWTGKADDVGASIGFTGSSLRGAIVIISTRRLIANVLPKEVGGGAGPDQIADWMGELANQLLGRIKNKLLSYGVTLEMSTPTVIFGLSLARKDTRSSVRRAFSFRHGEEPLTVSLDAIAAPDFELSGPGENAGAGIAEGEIALF